MKPGTWMQINGNECVKVSYIRHVKAYVMPKRGEEAEHVRLMVDVGRFNREGEAQSLCVHDGYTGPMLAALGLRLGEQHQETGVGTWQELLPIEPDEDEAPPAPKPKPRARKAPTKAEKAAAANDRWKD